MIDMFNDNDEGYSRCSDCGFFHFEGIYLSCGFFICRDCIRVNEEEYDNYEKYSYVVKIEEIEDDSL